MLYFCIITYRNLFGKAEKMRLSDEQDDRGMGLPVVYTIIGVAAVIFIILAVVILNNRNNGRHQTSAEPIAEQRETQEMTEAAEAESQANEETSLFAGKGEEYIEKLYRENKLTADDLDFWDMYPEEETVTEEKKEVKPEEPVATPEPTEDPKTDGKHTLVEYADGSKEWQTINSYLTLNNYDLSKFRITDERVDYYEGEKKISYTGVDLSKYNGTVNFSQVKADGIDFVMLRLGSRGYESGKIVLDENFVTNIKGATDAGLNVGVYFFSQAITVEEAVEEANFVIQNLSTYKITYPVVFDMEHIANDTARIDALTQDTKTSIADAFLNTIQTAGYIPMLYGNKEWLLTQVNLTGLTRYDIWLSQQADIPDYPYLFQMWQYSLKGTVSGIGTEADLNICFVDYSKR